MVEAIDVEAVVTTYLSGELTGAVGTVHQPKQSYPFTMVQRVGGVGPVPRWLDQASIQLDTWGDTREEARDEAALALDVLDRLPGVVPLGVVTDVQQIIGLSWLPDDNGQPRYMAQVAVYAHP